MYNKHYTIEWVGTTFWGKDYSDSKRFESGEEEEMAKFLFDLAHNSEVRTYWKTTLEEYKKEGLKSLDKRFDLWYNQDTK